MSSIRYEFIMSQIKHIRDIKENKKTKISLVFYEGDQTPCVFKICKGRDLSAVYQALMEVRHPNLAIVYDCVYENGNTYVIEEYISGKTLEELLAEQGPFSEDDTVCIMKELCGGLEVMHQHEPPIIHNDIKSSNIMLCEDGNVKLFDFDISRIYKIGSNKNTNLMGTYEYAAPEHYGFGQSEPCTDIYSLGITMHEMLTGVGLSFDHSVTYEGKLSDIIRKCVEIDRKKRYATAALLKNDLEKFQKNSAFVWKYALAIFCGIIVAMVGGVFLYDAVSNIKDSPGIVESQGSETEEVKESELETDEIIETEKTESTENTGTTDKVDKETLNTEEKPSIEENPNSEVPPSSEEKPNTEVNGESTPSVKPSEPPETESEEVNVPKKEMKIIAPIQGTFLTMDAWNDGTFLYMEELSGAYYLRSSDGKEKQLDIASVAYGTQLECNPYTDQMYLLVFGYENEFVYAVTRDLEIEIVASKVPSGKVYVDFFSDGTLIHNNELLNSRDWSLISYYSKAGLHNIINDKHYILTSISTYNKTEYSFFELNENCDIIREFSIKDAGINIRDYYGNETIYSNSKSVYFIGEKEQKQYVFCFDGEKFIPVINVTDYNGCNGFWQYEGLCVTNSVVRCYSKEYGNGTIVEFKIE